jgi:alkylation response protein AidB-like acyl-CoA dehydrogenase
MTEQRSFMRSLCMGEIEEDLVVPFPTLPAEERELVETVLGSLGQLLGSHEGDFPTWDREGKFPPGFIDELKEFGLFSLIIPEEFGGMGMGSKAYSRTLQEVARHDASTAVTVGAHSSIGMRGLLLFGTPEQKAKYLPRLATGEMIAAFCLTEPGSGSDAASIKTRAERDGDHWLLRGEKLWITDGELADFFTVFAKTGKDGEKGKISAFIVTRDLGGVSHSVHEDKMGIRACPTNAVMFDDVRVPHENLLGEEGKGFKVAMRILNSGRTGLGGGSVGAMKRLLSLATRQANGRSQFGRKIAEFGLIKRKVGEMVLDCYAAESVVTLVADLVDRGEQDYAVEAAISKVLASEALWRSADEALQIAGGNGFMREFAYEQIVRDARINRIFEGTNDILRLFIALSAMADVGQNLKDVSSSLRGVFEDPIKGFGVLREYALHRASLATGIKREHGAFSRLHPDLAVQQGIFEWGARELATATDKLLRRHGKKIIERQLATARLADMMIQLYALACVLSRVTASIEERGVAGAAHELALARALGSRVRRVIKASAEEIDDNADEDVKLLADHAFDLEKYAWDTL